MMEDLYLGENPADEDGAQVGQPDYMEKARKETRVFIGQLRRQFGNEPDGARLYVKSNPHDFGTYLSVNVSYNEKSEEATDYAFKLEGEFPEKWDDEARKELGITG